MEYLELHGSLTFLSSVGAVHQMKKNELLMMNLQLTDIIILSSATSDLCLSYTRKRYSDVSRIIRFDHHKLCSTSRSTTFRRVEKKGNDNPLKGVIQCCDFFCVTAPKFILK